MTQGCSSEVPYDWRTRRRHLDLPFPTSEYKTHVVCLSNFIPFDGDANVVLSAGARTSELVAGRRWRVGRAWGYVPGENLPRPLRPPRDSRFVLRDSVAGPGGRHAQAEHVICIRTDDHILDFGTAVIEDVVLVTKGGAESLTPYERVH